MSDEQVSRRSVLRGVAVTTVAGVAGYAVAATSDAAGARAATTAANGYGADEQTRSRLAALADIPAGGGLILDDARVVLTRAEDGEVLAFSATCTHQGCTVSSIEQGLSSARATSVASTSPPALRCRVRHDDRCPRSRSRSRARRCSSGEGG